MFLNYPQFNHSSSRIKKKKGIQADSPSFAFAINEIILFPYSYYITVQTF